MTNSPLSAKFAMNIVTFLEITPKIKRNSKKGIHRRTIKENKENAWIQ